MTRNLKIFLTFCLLWAAIFFAILINGLKNHQATSGAYLSWFVVFVVVQSSVQRYLASHDSQRASRINLPAWYACISAAASLVVTCGWIMVWHNNIGLAIAAAAGSVATVCITAFTMSKGRLKASKKEDLFP